MRKIFLYMACFVFIFNIMACVTGSDPKTFVYQSSDHRLLYDLMVERCAAINARDGNRLKRVYAKDASEPEWLIKNWFPNYNQYSVTMEVSKVKKITIVDIDAVGAYVLSLSGQLARSSIAQVDVLYIKEDNEGENPCNIIVKTLPVTVGLQKLY